MSTYLSPSDLTDAVEAAETLCGALERRCGVQFDESWTPRDAALCAEDEWVDGFADWYEQTFGGVV